MLVVIHGVTDEVLSSDGQSPAQSFFSDAFPDASVIEFQFPRVPFDQSSRSTDIKQQARSVNEALLGRRDWHDNENLSQSSSLNLPLSPIIFIGHDLGGSLIKQTLLLAMEESKFEPIRQGVKGVIFVGTPHRGADVAFWEYHIIRLLAISKLQGGSPSQLLQTLPQDLYGGAEDFAETSWDFNILNLFQRGEAVLHEAFASLHSNKAKNKGLSGSHAELWEFRLGDRKTEIVCKEIEQMVKIEKPRKGQDEASVLEEKGAALTVAVAIQDHLQTFLRALSQLDPETRRRSTVKPAPDSIYWILKHRSYQEWVSRSDTGILHVFGPAGSGTTVLATHILKLAVESQGYPQATMLRFFFDKNNVRARSQKSAFVSLSRQLLLARPGLFRHVRALCDFMYQRSLFNKNVLWSLLRSLLTHCTEPAVYCIIHSVHECDEPLDEVIRGFSEIVHMSGGSVKIVLTSDEKFALAHMQPCPCVFSNCRSVSSSDWPQASLAVDALVREYVARVAREKPLWAEFADAITKALCAPPTTYLSAMHRMARLQAADIRSSPGAILTKLDELRLDSLGQPSNSPPWVRSAFRWVAYALRPLVVDELAVAVAFDEFRSARACSPTPDDNYTELEALSSLIPRDIIGDLTREARPLIRADGNRVVPAHSSLRELLHNSANSEEELFDPHYLIFSACLEYLKFVSLIYSAPFYDLDEQYKLETALLNYAVAFWPDHYKSLRHEFHSQARERVGAFFNDGDCFLFWMERYRKRENTLSVELHPKDNLRLLASCQLGLEELFDREFREVDAIPNPNERLEQLHIALDHASKFGQLAFVCVLLAALDYARSQVARALGFAAAGGHSEVVSALLKAEPATITWADDSEKGSKYTALHHAVCSGDRKTFEILVGHPNAPLNAQASDGSSALCLAARTGQISMVDTLINCHADVTLEDKYGYDALRLAARGGFSEIVRILLAKDVDPATPDAHGNTALHLATQFGHPITLEYLLRCFSDVKCVNKLELTPLHIAVAEGHLEILKLLLNAQPPTSGRIPSHLDDVQETPRKTPITITFKYPAPPLQIAAGNGRIDLVEALLQDRAGHTMEDCCRAMFAAAGEGLFEVTQLLLRHGSIADVRDQYGTTILHQAVNGRDAAVLSMLLEAVSGDMGIDTPNNLGLTALHMAANIGTLAIVKPLLAKKADVNAQTRDGNTPLHFATREGHRLVAQELLQDMTNIEKENYSNETPFVLAVGRGHVEIVKDLLRSKKGLDYPFHSKVVLQQENVLNALLESKEWDCSKPDKEQSGQTPLHLAVTWELPRAIHLLLEARADVNAKDEDNKTPLFIAAEEGFVECVKPLLQARADVNTTDSFGRTPLYAASLQGHVETVNALLANDPKPDVDLANKRGWVPLHAATEEPQITKLLLDAGADPRRRTTNSGMIPFSRACFADSRIDVVRCYLGYKENADLPDIQDNDGETAAHRSVIGGSELVMKELIRHGAKLDVQRNDGNTPLHLAISGKVISMANLLLDKEVDISKRSKQLGTILMATASAGQVDIADRLYKRQVDVNEECEPYHTALNAAAYFGHLNMVEWLLRNGANPKATGRTYGNPLSAALAALESNSHDIEAIVRELVVEGHADVNYVTAKGASVLRMAVDRGLTDIVEFLLHHSANTAGEDPAKQPLVLEVVQTGKVTMLKAMLRDPANLSVRDKFGRPLLSVAIEARRDDVVEALLTLADDDGADVGLDTGDHAGRTPLILCVVKRGASLARLLSRVTDVDARDCEGKTALAHACIIDAKATVSSLLDAGASPSSRDCRGRGPLYWACRRSSMDVVRLVLRALHRDDRKGKMRKESKASCVAECATAVAAAVASNRPAFLEVLLGEMPRPVVSVAVDGWTPLYAAERYGLEPMKKMLLKAGFVDGNPSKKLDSKAGELAPAQVVGDKAAALPAVDSKTEGDGVGVAQLSLDNLPSEWSAYDKTPCLVVDRETPCVVTVGDRPLTPGDNWPSETQATVRANFPMSPIRELGNVYYFEVTIEKNKDPRHWAVGFCEEDARLNLAVGWDEGAWGWHGDDGDVFTENIYFAFSGPYDQGNTVGCGVDFDNESAFFTKDGEIVGQAFKGIKGKLYPAVSANQCMKGAKVSATFWRGSKADYKFKAFGHPRTREPPKGSGEKDDEAPAEDVDVVPLGDDGQAELDIELEVEGPLPSIEVEGPLPSLEMKGPLPSIEMERVVSKVVFEY
ncbi:hypothetical protein DL769_004928 [Monosporascus sp. CRB-8-3]|nr:hypothetical protein DL769_004928 [Monosporascus sp. CRB-8-3]